MFKISKKIKKGITSMGLAAVIAVCGSGSLVAHASDITSGEWSVHYYSPAASKKTDYVILTCRKQSTFEAKCKGYSNNNVQVDFSDNPITTAGDGALVFTSAGTKRFKFTTGSSEGEDTKINFKLKLSGNDTGSATGSAYLKY